MDPAARRVTAMPKKKSASGAAKAEIRLLALAHTRAAVATLAEIMTHPDAPLASRIAAAQALLDRGWGKIAAPVEGATMLEDMLDRIAKRRLLTRKSTP